MEALARFLDKLYTKEAEHTKSPSALSRLEIDNLKTRINREEEKIRARLLSEGMSGDKINEIIKKVVCSVSPMSINNGEIERMADFLFSCQQTNLINRK